MDTVIPEPGCAPWCVLGPDHPGAPCLGPAHTVVVADEHPPVLHLYRDCGWPTGVRVNLGERDAGWTLTPVQARLLASRLVDLAEEAEQAGRDHNVRETGAPIPLWARWLRSLLFWVCGSRLSR